jgi:hypothetical protein
MHRPISILPRRANQGPGAMSRILRRRALAPSVFALAVSGLSPLPAQVVPDTSRVTISGIVVDRWSSRPIPNAVVRFAETDFQARTDAKGEFTLENLLRGSYFLMVDAPGYQPRRGGLRVIRTGSLQIPMDPTGEVQLLTAPPPRSPGSRVLGRVVEMESGRAMEGAEVSLEGVQESRITDSGGRFEFESAPSGRQAVSVTTLGRAPLSETVEVTPGQTLEMEIRLAAQPVEVDPMVVTATPRSSYLEQMGYYNRRDQGYSGQFVSREAIAERDPRSLGDILAVTPGVRVQYGAAGGFEVRLRRAIQISQSGGVGCVPAVYLDDVPVDVGWLQNIPPDRVDGMEIFTGANAPLRYNDPCGVILIWTRRGEPGGA